MLLGKWVWRFASEDKTLWKRVIFGKYGEKERVGVLGKVAMVLALGWERKLGEGGTPLIEEPFSNVGNNRRV